MKSNQLRKTDAPEAEQRESEAARPVWFLGKEIKVHSAKDGKREIPAPRAMTKDADVAISQKTATVDDRQEQPHERRPSQLEAYMRYAKMRQPVSEDEETLAPVRTRRFPANRHAASNENELGWSGEAPRPRPRREPAYGFRMRDAVLAGVASIAIGALAGAVVYDRANNGELSSAVFDSIGGFVTGFGSSEKVIADAGEAGVSVVEGEQNVPAALKKPVATARLDISDAKGDINSPIPLNISAEPAAPNQDIAFRLSGLPADAYLTAGSRDADNAWILKPGEELGVKLMVPSLPAAPLLIAVEAIEPRTGDLAAPAEEMKVALATPAPAPSSAPAAIPSPSAAVQPVSAPPTDVIRNFNLPSTTKHAVPGAQPIPEPLENNGNGAGGGDSSSLMLNGDKLLGLGDFTAARAFFSKARELGNREASLRLGQTYDPLVFRDKNVQGLKPDPAMALKYYLEARTAGIADADTAIAGLETWMKQ